MIQFPEGINLPGLPGTGGGRDFHQNHYNILERLSSAAREVMGRLGLGLVLEVELGWLGCVGLGRLSFGFVGLCWDRFHWFDIG